MTEFLKSEKVYLRPYQPSDCEKIAEWLNDPEVTCFMFYGQLPKTVEQIKSFIEADLANPNKVIFIVCGAVSGAAIGFCGLYDWHRTAHKAEMRILIGDKSRWGGGYGTETVQLLTWYGFDRLNLHRIYLGFTADNKAAQAAYIKAGYMVEGVLQDDIFRNGRYYDSVRMAILRSHYEERFKAEWGKRFALKSPKYLKKGR